MAQNASRVISRNDDAGITSYFHYDRGTGGFTVEDRQDVEPVLEINKAQANEIASGWKGDFHHIARIPNTIMENLRKEGILDDPKRFKAWLNERDNRLFRTRPGRV